MSNGNKKNLGQTLYFSQFGGERPIPEPFVAAMERAEERTSGYAANAEIPQNFKDDVNVVDVYFDSREQRTNEKVLVVVRKKSGNITLRDFRTTDQGQTVQVDSTLFYKTDTTFTRAYPSSTQDVAIKDLGNRWSIQEVAVSGIFVGDVFAPQPFARDSYAKERPNLIPEKFRALVPTLRTKNVVDGQAAIPTLGASEFYRSEEDLTAFRKLVEVLELETITFPVTSNDTATITEYGGGLVNISSTLAVAGTLAPEEGEGVVSSKVMKLGEGHELRDTVSRYAGAWPTRRFARWVARLQTFVTGTKQVLGINTGAVGLVGSSVKEVVEIDGYREEQIISDQTTALAALDAYVRVLHNNTSVSVPPQLVSVESRYSKDGGAGSYTENGSYNLSASYGVGSLQLRGSAQASASVIPEIVPIVKIPRTQNIPCKHILLYVSNTATRDAIRALINTALGSPGVSEWPDFRPQQMLVLLKGGKVNGRLDVSASGHDAIATDFNGVVKYSGYSRTNGRGISFDLSQVSRLVQIPETIHGTISSIGGDGASDSTAYGATGSINCGAVSSAPIGGVATAVGSVEILSGGGATPGANQTIPATGQYLHRLVTEPDVEFNRVKVFAEVVDFANIYV